jgi:hypothetical protein
VTKTYQSWSHALRAILGHRIAALTLKATGTGNSTEHEHGRPVVFDLSRSIPQQGDRSVSFTKLLSVEDVFLFFNYDLLFN